MCSSMSLTQRAVCVFMCVTAINAGNTNRLKATSCNKLHPKRWKRHTDKYLIAFACSCAI